MVIAFATGPFCFLVLTRWPMSRRTSGKLARRFLLPEGAKVREEQDVERKKRMGKQTNFKKITFHILFDLVVDSVVFNFLFLMLVSFFFVLVDLVNGQAATTTFTVCAVSQHVIPVLTVIIFSFIFFRPGGSGGGGAGGSVLIQTDEESNASLINVAGGPPGANYYAGSIGLAS